MAPKEQRTTQCTGTGAPRSKPKTLSRSRPRLAAKTPRRGQREQAAPLCRKPGILSRSKAQQLPTEFGRNKADSESVLPRRPGTQARLGARIPSEKPQDRECPRSQISARQPRTNLSQATRQASGNNRASQRGRGKASRRTH